MLTEQLLATFAHDGVIKLGGLLPADRVKAARDVVCEALAMLGLWRDGGWRLDAVPRPEWPATGLKPGRDIGHDRPEFRALMDDAALMAVVEELTGGGPFDRSIHGKAQVLCSLPNIERWRMPSSLHIDVPRLADDQSAGVQAFAIVEPVGPHGGGTVVVAGSHRLLADRGALKPRTFWRLLRDEPFFRAFVDEPETEGDLPAGSCLGVPLQVMELTGEPGDVWITDLCVLHAASPNQAHRPRVMVTDRFAPVGLVPAIETAYGWSDRQLRIIRISG